MTPQYTLICDEGVVIDGDGVVVAPCQSADDPSFVAYVQWCESGNQPIVVQTRPVE